MRERRLSLTCDVVLGMKNHKRLVYHLQVYQLPPNQLLPNPSMIPLKSCALQMMISLKVVKSKVILMMKTNHRLVALHLPNKLSPVPHLQSRGRIALLSCGTGSLSLLRFHFLSEFKLCDCRQVSSSQEQKGPAVVQTSSSPVASTISSVTFSSESETIEGSNEACARVR